MKLSGNSFRWPDNVRAMQNYRLSCLLHALTLTSEDALHRTLSFVSASRSSMTANVKNTLENFLVCVSINNRLILFQTPEAGSRNL